MASTAVLHDQTENATQPVGYSEPASTLAEGVYMPETSCPARIILTTAASPEEARTLGRTLVEEQFAACATLIPAVESIYRWKGNIESSSETILLLKSGVDQLASLENRIRQLHSYEVPEFLVLPVEAGSRTYLDWMLGSLVSVENGPPAEASASED
jgi:periplasmic divalent cation tolerance protein